MDEKAESPFLQSPRTIRARLNYDPPPTRSNVTIRSTHQFITDKYNPIPLSPRSIRGTIPAPETAAAKNQRHVEQSERYDDFGKAPETAGTAAAATSNIAELKNDFMQRKEEREQFSKEFSDYLQNVMHSNDRAQPVVQHVFDEAIHVESARAPELLLDDNMPIEQQQIGTDRDRGHEEMVALDHKQKPPPQQRKTTIEIPMLDIESPLRLEPGKKPTYLNNNRCGADSSVPGTSRLFDSARARKFMAEQQRKRRAAKSADAVAKQTLAERKRRLAELERHTRQIVQRNVCKNAARSARRARNVPEILMLTAREPEIESQPHTQRPFHRHPLQQTHPRGPDRGAIQFAFAAPPTPTPTTAEPPAASATAEQALVANAAAAPPAAPPADTMPAQATLHSDSGASIGASTAAEDNNQRRIGILRRCSLSPQSQSSRRNTSKQPTTRPAQPPRPPRVPSATRQNLHIDLQNLATQSSAHSDTQPDLKLRVEPLRVPNVQLQTSATNVLAAAAEPRKKPAAHKTGQPKKHQPKAAAAAAAVAPSKPPPSDTDEVPFWLRPSPMQAYPYNFIMAVRKKLDLIANPTMSTAGGDVGAPRKERTNKPPTKSQPKTKTSVAVRPSGGNGRNELQSGERIDLKEYPAAAELGRPDLVSDSDALTTISSYSLQLPLTASNSHRPPANVAETQQPAISAQSDSDSQATLSMSSAILSQSSPEKRRHKQLVEPPPEPLSTNAIADMHVSLPSHPFVSYRRGSQPATAAASKSGTQSQRRQWDGSSSKQQQQPPKKPHPQAASSTSSAASSQPHSRSRSSSSVAASAAPSTLVDRSNIMEMLDSFNRSLSHAISVNQKLHETLNRPTMRSTVAPADTEHRAPPTSGGTTNDEYSSRFDSTTSSVSQPLAAGQQTESGAATSQLEQESSVRLTADSTSARSASSSIRTADLPPTAASSTSSEVAADARKPATSAASPSLVSVQSVQSLVSSAKPAADDSPIPTSVDPSPRSLDTPSNQTAKSHKSSSIRTQIGGGSGGDSLSRPTTADDSSAISSVARNFEQSYAAPPSIGSLEAANYLPAYVPLTPSTAQDRRPSSTTSTLQSSSLRSATSSSTLTIKSLHISRNSPAMANVTDRQRHHNDNNKENMALGESPGEIGASKKSTVGHNKPDLNQSIGSDIFAVFNQTDFEINASSSVAHAAASTTIVSEANLSYSTLGMYDQLLKTEDQKSLDLTALLKVREKSLIDRTKGQIAWLELQKQKYQERGMTAQISVVKKKQRALLVRLDRERAALAKSTKPTTATNSTPFAGRPSSKPSSPAVLRLSHQTPARCASPLVLQRHNPATASNTNIIANTTGASATPGAGKSTAMRAIDFAATGDNRLESMLAEREERLRRRRAHVESLVRWHQRLDEEEGAVAAMEAQLMAHTNRRSRQQHIGIHSAGGQTESSPMSSSRYAPSVQQPNRHQQRQIRSIEHSLEILHALPAGQQLDTSHSHLTNPSPDPSQQNLSTTSQPTADVERVSVSGSRMNRLWRRLTGESACKFIPERRYELSKADIASIYEEAKRCVLGQFSETTGASDLRGRVRVLDQSQLSQMSIVVAATDDKQPKSQRDAAGSPNVLVSARGSQLNGSGDGSGSVCDEFIVVPALNLNFTSNDEQSTMSASEADCGGFGGGANGTTDTSARDGGFYFTDNVVPTVESSTAPSQQQQEPPQQHTVFSRLLPIVGDTFPDSPDSARTYSVRSPLPPPAANTTFRDSAAFSVDSLNGSCADLSERNANGAGHVDIWNRSSFGMSAEACYVDEQMPADAELGGYKMPDLSPHIPTTVDSISQSSPTIITNRAADNASSDDDDPTTIAATTDNDHLFVQQQQQTTSSYSDSFEPTATPTTTTNTITASDKITEQPTQQQSSSISELSGAQQIASEFSTEDEATTSSVPITVEPDSQMSSSVPPEDDDVHDEAAEAEVSDELVVSEVRSASAASVASSSSSPTIADNVSLSDSIVVVVPEGDTPPYKMPDIISEAEVLRRQQMLIEEEIKQLEESAAATASETETPPPFVAYIREIPNKPPPPYVPPAAGSPMAAIIPSAARISEIVNGRVEQLMLLENAPPPADENITNIYERIALDICDECVAEWRAAERRPLAHFRQPLAFYNPPDRLECMQRHVLRRVHKLLGLPQPAMSELAPNEAAAAAVANTDLQSSQPPTTINYVKRLLINGGGGNGGHHHHLGAQDPSGCGGGAKRKLWWNDILLHEMMEDDAAWTNFDAERTEVLESVGDEIVRMLIEETLAECEQTFGRKAKGRAAAAEIEQVLSSAKE